MTAFDWVLGHTHPSGRPVTAKLKKPRRSDRLRQKDWTKGRRPDYTRLRPEKLQPAGEPVAGPSGSPQARHRPCVVRQAYGAVAARCGRDRAGYPVWAWTARRA